MPRHDQLSAATHSRFNRAILRRLSLVSIVLDHDDNPHLIFESLNYKGEPLTQGDLIRNYFLMRIPANEQDKVFKDSWEPMQLRLGAQLSEFVRHFLMRQGSFVKQGEIYRTLKEQTDGKKQSEILALLSAMRQSAAHYHRLLEPTQENLSSLRYRLLRFRRLDVGVSWPFILNLYSDHEHGKISNDVFCNILDILENFFIRRFICSIPTHGLNKVFPPLYNQAATHPSLEQGVREILCQRDYPNDSSFRKALIDVRLYGTGERLSKAKLILETMERALAGKETVQTETLTIEHVLPQTLSSWWQSHLGENWQEVHETRLHCLGNLTLSGYNSELSNDDFPTKRDVFSKSPINLNRSIAKFEHWNDAAIQDRAEELSDLALRIWPNFGPDDALKASVIKKGFTGRLPLSVTVLGTTKAAKTWRDVLQVTVEVVREAAPDAFDGIAEQFPRLFSKRAESFRAPRQLQETELFFETNLSAESVGRYCSQIVQVAGYPSEEWSVDTRQ